MTRSAPLPLYARVASLSRAELAAEVARLAQENRALRYELAKERRASQQARDAYEEFRSAVT